MKCPQKECSFNGICVGREDSMVGCQNCEECGCEPNIIDTNCDRCLSCSRDEGDLRWGSPTNDDVEREIEIKPIEVETK